MLTNVVVRGEPSNETIDSSVKPVPLIVSVNGAPFTGAAFGLSDVMAGPPDESVTLNSTGADVVLLTTCRTVDRELACRRHIARQQRDRHLRRADERHRPLRAGEVDGVGVQKAAAVDQHVEPRRSRPVPNGIEAGDDRRVGVDDGQRLRGRRRCAAARIRDGDRQLAGIRDLGGRMVVVKVVELTKVVVCDAALTLMCAPLRKLEPVAVSVNELPLAVVEFGEIEVSCG